MGHARPEAAGLLGLKVAGRRAYALARAGQEVQLAPRPVTIYRLEVVDYQYPQLELEIECSAGTYVRSLGRDLAESLGTGPCVGPGPHGNWPLPARRCPAAPPADARLACRRMHDPLSAVAHLPRLSLSRAEQDHVLAGGTIPARSIAAEAAGEIAAVDAEGRLVALLAQAADGTFRPTRHRGAGVRRPRKEHFTRLAELASDSEVCQNPHPSLKRFSSDARTLQWLDRRIGAPVCLLLTLSRRLGEVFGGRGAAGGVRSILFLKLAEQGSTVLAHEAVRSAVARVGRENVHFLVFEENRFIVDLIDLVPGRTCSRCAPSPPGP